MAVFTPVSRAEASAFVARLGVGVLTDLRGIQAGIENSNFFVDTLDNGTSRHWVLTVFERLTFEQLPFYLETRGYAEPALTGAVLGALMIAGGISALFYPRLCARIAGH